MSTKLKSFVELTSTPRPARWQDQFGSDVSKILLRPCGVRQYAQIMAHLDANPELLRNANLDSVLRLLQRVLDYLRNCTVGKPPRFTRTRPIGESEMHTVETSPVCSAEDTYWKEALPELTPDEQQVIRLKILVHNERRSRS